MLVPSPRASGWEGPGGAPTPLLSLAGRRCVFTVAQNQLQGDYPNQAEPRWTKASLSLKSLLGKSPLDSVVIVIVTREIHVTFISEGTEGLSGASPSFQGWSPFEE